MTAPLSPYAPAEYIIIAALRAEIPTDNVAVETGNDLLTSLPFWRVARIGGSDDDINDLARVDVDTFAATRAQAQQLADQTRFIIRGLRGRVFYGRLVDNVTTESAPVWVDYADEHVHRFVATYQVTTRIF